MIVISVNDRSVTAYLCNASGVNSVSTGNGHGSLTSKGATNFHIGYDPYDTAGRALKGKMGVAMVYSVALSSADITSIFNAQKVVFGLYYINEIISHPLIPFLRIDFTCAADNVWWK
jgi:hypothetical protein